MGGLNRRWDEPLALKRMDELAIPLHRRVGLLSGGQRAQLALALAVARRPDLIVLDEPTARLDPLARADFTAALMRSVADTGMSVFFSSHVVEDLERTCDYLIVIAGGRVSLAGDVDDLLAEHRLIITDPRTASHLSRRIPVIEQTNAARQVHLLARLKPDVTLPPAATIRPLGIRELILAYLRATQATHPPSPTR
jgi:ABC-2 type transport system ATP-binding protein